jgi:hypothetical protein
MLSAQNQRIAEPSEARDAAVEMSERKYPIKPPEPRIGAEISIAVQNGDARNTRRSFVPASRLTALTISYFTYIDRSIKRITRILNPRDTVPTTGSLHRLPFLSTKARAKRVLAAAGRRGGRLNFQRRSDNLFLAYKSRLQEARA